MTVRASSSVAALDRLDAALAAQAERLSTVAREPLDRWRSEAGAVRYHLLGGPGASAVTVVLGGTGTGKSTLVNRLIGATVTAASFRRTFTTGPVAVVNEPGDLPERWLGVSHISADPAAPPPRGQTGALVVVIHSAAPPRSAEPSGSAAGSPLTTPLIDTPDLDGDQPANHAQADRAFRWADRVVFVVTPEKYQMTELLPYYRLARRYGTAALFAMNKCEEAAVPADFAKQLGDREWPDAHVYIVPRDDAAYDPPTEANLDALRAALNQPVPRPPSDGPAHRVADAVARLNDQVLTPMRAARRQADQLIAALRAMEAPAAGVDVNPITQQLQRRLQQRSVLYLLGPQRMLDRVRQMPTLLARMPRATWDWVTRGQMPDDLVNPKTPTVAGEPPDFAATLADQFTVLRSRIDDLLRGDAAAKQWVTADAAAYASALFPPAAAAAIAEDEIAKLRTWLESRWNATPRDTRMLQALLKHMPGGRHLTKWSEAAPYLLTAVMVTHHFLFPHIDLIVFGGYTLATWLGERVSNEVTSHTRATNRRIGDRFEGLAHDQIARVSDWLDRQAPTTAEIEQLEKLAGEWAEG